MQLKNKTEVACLYQAGNSKELKSEILLTKRPIHQKWHDEFIKWCQFDKDRKWNNAYNMPWVHLQCDNQIMLSNAKGSKVYRKNADVIIMN